MAEGMEEVKLEAQSEKSESEKQIKRETSVGMAEGMEEVKLEAQSEKSESEKQIKRETSVVISNETRHLTIVLLGKTGSGKSETVNTITGKITAETESSTVTCNTYEELIHDYNLKIIDTPGFCSQKVDNEKIFNCVRTVLNENSTIVGRRLVILLVIKKGKFMDEEFFTLSMINEIASQHDEYRTFILFTHKDEFDAAKLTVDEYILNADDSLKVIVSRLSNSYFTMNNKAHRDIRNQGAKILLDQLWLHVQPLCDEPFYTRYPKHVFSYLRGVFTSVYVSVSSSIYSYIRRRKQPEISEGKHFMVHEFNY